MNNKILILTAITFLLTGFFNNSDAINILVSSDTLPNTKEKTILEHEIDRQCKDSIIQDFENNNSVLLYISLYNYIKLIRITTIVSKHTK